MFYIFIAARAASISSHAIIMLPYFTDIFFHNLPVMVLTVPAWQVAHLAGSGFTNFLIALKFLVVVVERFPRQIREFAEVVDVSYTITALSLSKPCTANSLDTYSASSFIIACYAIK